MKLRFQLVAVAVCMGIGMAHAQSDALRPEIGKPLKAAQELVKARKFKEALAKVREADAVPHRTPQESYTLERMRMAAAVGAGDMDSATRAYEALNTSGRLPVDDSLRMLEAVADAYYRAKDYAKAISWTQRYLKSGGSSPQMRKLLIQSQVLSGDNAGAARELKAEIQASEKAGTPPAEDRLTLLLGVSARHTDSSTYMYALEKLVATYPKPQYWAQWLAHLRSRPGFSERYTLDIYRLMLASASLRHANDYMDMAQLSLQAGYAAEAQAALAQGFASHVLGTGEQAARHKRLRDLANKQADEARAKAPANETQDGTMLVNLGLGLALSGQAAQGVTLIEKGIAKGGLTRPDDAKLRLGQALVLAGQSAKAASVLGTVTGKDGAADLARAWVLLSRHQQGR